ncbi:MAG: hypothetical protein A3G77_07720 [Acidobacteria bacterium RIFCSPLOWO2_12_FULL_68_19]|nr:MAG: hypothetical protein A3G77_07720 [Acidobacteria bacterium RIFCSPLOWO2_12_FULL_68_19]
MTLRERIVAQGTVMILILAPCAAHGQQAPAPQPEWFAGGAVGMTVSRSGEPDGQNPSVLSPAIEGSALQGSLAVGAFVTPRLGFSAELGMPASFDVQQTWGRDATTWDHAHRDVTLSGLFLVRGGVGRSQLTGAVGAGSVWSRTTTVARFRRFGQRTTDQPFSVFTEARQVTDLGIVAGAELSVPLSSRVSLGPQFRAVFVRRGESDEFQDRLPSVLYQVGAGLRVRLR